MSGNLRIVQLFLDYGADVNAGAPLHYVCKGTKKGAGNTQEIEAIIRLLLSNGAKFQSDVTSAIAHHVNANRVSTVKLLLEEGACVNGYYPLYRACRHGKKPMITLLMQANADPDTRPEIGGRTARGLKGFKKWAKKNPSLVPPIKSSTPKSSGKILDSNRHPDEGDQEDSLSGTPA
ncbi:hypothetical protein BDD12DRAFT_853126 [Trichophaea hybrida]|nr:hypothetical protein BDD12DRAFT_853126 [Trichophaea hybrida]